MGAAPLSRRGAVLWGPLDTPPQKGPSPVTEWTEHPDSDRTRGSSHGAGGICGGSGGGNGSGCGRIWAWVLVVVAWAAVLAPTCQANPDAKRLYDDLLSSYNRLIRPVGNNSDRLTVKLGLKLSQLIDVNLKNQIMTTNVWVEQEWRDYKLVWEPVDYGGVDILHVPSEHIWLPDIVLYNNADGNYEVTIMTKAVLHYDGRVTWKPPAIYKSSCEIDVEFFPFDQQTCFMKFGSWTYDGYMVDLQHLHQQRGSNLVDPGIDLNDYYISVEWDILKVPALRNERFYPCCQEPYPDIYFNITMRRKTLFYTVNLIIPCVGISFLSVLVFYLPSDSGEKVSLCISILLSLTVFFLLLAEIIPPTSLAVPLLGKYLLFTMILVTLSVMVTIGVLNVNFRSPSTHKMAPWVRKIFIELLPKFLWVERPLKDDEGPDEVTAGVDTSFTPSSDGFDKFPFDDHPYDIPAIPPSPYDRDRYGDDHLALPAPECHAQTHAHTHEAAFVQELEEPRQYHEHRTLRSIEYIAQHMRNVDSFEEIEDDWRYVAMVLDRLFLWIFMVACVIGTFGIIFRAPALYDTTTPIDIQLSKVAQHRRLDPMGPEE
ncbi:acetylcholine receptor subunit alpha-like 1 isoform X1 [Panulirus ornatus]|uniref:acetylcholine receptor subunit alpha-like 1 isoform X1 n=2 Tax=Panulirus ornatus TaxID=150431 RepID=UPI003A8BDF42